MKVNHRAYCTCWPRLHSTSTVHQRYADSYYNYIVVFVSPHRTSPAWSTWNANWMLTCHMCDVCLWNLLTQNNSWNAVDIYLVCTAPRKITTLWVKYRCIRLPSRLNTNNFAGYKYSVTPPSRKRNRNAGFKFHLPEKTMNINREI